MNNWFEEAIDNLKRYDNQIVIKADKVKKYFSANQEEMPIVDPGWTFEEKDDGFDILDDVDWKQVNIRPSEIEFDNDVSVGLQKKIEWDATKRNRDENLRIRLENKRKLDNLEKQRAELVEREKLLSKKEVKKDEEPHNVTFGNSRILDL